MHVRILLIFLLSISSSLYSSHGECNAYPIEIKNDNFDEHLIQGWNSISPAYLEHKASGNHQGDLIEADYFKKLISAYASDAKYVLDACTGNGWFALSLLKWNILSRLVSLTGVDISPIMIETARSQTDDSRVTFICGALESNIYESCNIKNGSIDLIISSNALDCVHNIEEALQKLHELLRKNGILIVSIRHPKRNAYYVTGSSDGDFQEGAYAEKWPGTGNHEVIRFYRTEERWDHLINNAGFSILEKQIPAISESFAISYPEYYEYYKNKKYPGCLIYILKK